MYMKKNQKPSVGSTKTELNEYINILESRAFKQANKKEEQRKLNDKYDDLVKTIDNLIERVEILESRLNIISADVEDWNIKNIICK